MKPLLLFIITVSGLLANAQRTDSISRYYNSEHQITDTPQYAWYYGKSVLKDSLWHESNYYYPALKLYSYGVFRDKNLAIPVDSFYSFHLNGELRSIGNNINGKKDGLWLMYYEDGSLWKSANYTHGKPIGVSLSWYANGYPSDSTVWSETGGVCFSWNNEGRIQSIGPYNLDEQRQGAWKFYSTDGKLYSAEIYNNGELKDVKSFDEKGNSIPNKGLNTKSEVESAYPGGQLGWSVFLSSNIKYPETAIKREIEGKVEVEFFIDEKGGISNVKAISGPMELRQEAVRLIYKSGKWKPAIRHGIAIKSHKIQPFVFRLEGSY